MELRTVSINFSEDFGLSSIETLGAYTIGDMLRGIACYYPEFQSKVLNLNSTHLFKIRVNGEFTATELEDLNVLLPYEQNEVYIEALPIGAGNIAKIGLGVGLLVAGLSGVGILGLSATTIGLLGASLVFSSIFKQPKTDTNTKTDKRSVNFGGVINSTGGGQVLPLVFGEMAIGSIVVSAQIVPYETGV